MSAGYVVIGFENSQVEALERAMRMEFGDDVLRTPALGIHLSVVNYAEEYRTADQFLKAHGMEESNEFLRHFDILPFATELRLECAPGRPIEAAIEIVGDVIAMALSKRMKTRALVRIANGEVPFRLYSANGVTEIDYGVWYATLFISRSWIPSKVGQ